VLSVASGSNVDPTITSLTISGRIENASANIASFCSVKEYAPPALPLDAVAIPSGPDNLDYTDLGTNNQDMSGQGTYIF